MREARYRNLDSFQVLQDSNYGIEGKYLVSIHSDGPGKLMDENFQLTHSGKIARKYWEDIPKHFQAIEVQEHIITPDAFYGILNIDLSGKKVGEKMLYYNVVSHFEIAFGMMVAKKNPFLVEGSIFHVISWFKAASFLEIMKFGNFGFKWKSGYFDFSISGDDIEKDILEMIRNSVD